MEYTAGIDLGGTYTKFAILDEKEKIISKDSWKTGKVKTPDKIVETITTNFNENIKKSKLKKTSIKGVGLGCPGPLNSKTGIVECAPNFDNWKDVPLKEMLSSALSLPVKLYNDANAAAYGEYFKGTGKDSTNFILFTLGTGVGGGIIINKKLYTGSHDVAGELGHITIVPDGPLCGCGNRGCLEALTSATAIVRYANEAISQGAQTSLKKASEKNTLTSKSIFEAAKDGDAFARGILSETGRYLGIAAATIINSLNPDVIAFSGGLSAAGSFLFDPLKNEAKKRSFKNSFERVKILPSELGNDAGVIGAAGLYKIQ